MKWTKAHSQNAVAAKARRRLAQATAIIPDDPPRRIPRPRAAKPDFILRIEDRFGARLQISVVRFNGRYIISHGIKSVRQLCRGIEQLLTKSA